MSKIDLVEPSSAPATVAPFERGGPKLSRRALLQWSGLSVTALILASTQPQAAQATVDVPPLRAPEDDPRVGLLIDLTRCTGCQSCAAACQVANSRPESITPPTALSSDAYSFVDCRSCPPTGATADVDPLKTVYVKHQCMHCEHPACVSACTVGALQKSALGPVIYDADKCIGCRYCQYACPFGVPTYDWENALGLIHKCQMCAQRQATGELPACVGACPNGALRFGKRHELLAQAHAQIATNPNRYIDHVYGEFEVGGTAVLYLSAVPFVELGFPSLGNEPIPHNAETVMERTPLIALGVATVVSVLHQLTAHTHAAEGSFVGDGNTTQSAPTNNAGTIGAHQESDGEIS
jgi:formate dehydrogenase iron-sulfur subunit